jgi:multicomponent K+:H+ antiporter subunit A
VFLLMRMYPVLAGSGWFEVIVTTAGLVTVLFAAFIAIFKHDLKGLLAYSTVSHLGLVTFLVGLGSPLAAVAAVFHVLNHATFKASLFMIAGIVDHETHSRDMRQLGGLWKLMPWTATLSMVAAASMAGVPLTNGFLSKEMFFTEAVVGTSGPLGLAGAGAGDAGRRLQRGLFAAFCARHLFQRPDLGDVPNTHPHEPPLGMKLPAMLLVSCASWWACCRPSPLARWSMWRPRPWWPAPARIPPVHLARLQPAAAHERHRAGGRLACTCGWRAGKRLHRISSEDWFGRHRSPDVRGHDRWSVRPGGRVSRGWKTARLQRYLAWLVAAAIVLGPHRAGQRHRHRLAGAVACQPAGLAIWLLLLATCVALVLTHHQRFQAVVLVGWWAWLLH